MENTAKNMDNMENNSSNSTQGKIDFKSIVDRAKNICVDPAGAMETVRNESTTIPEIYKKYLIIIAAVGPVFLWLKFCIIGTGVGIVTYRAPIFSTLIHFILQYAVSLVSIYAGALILEKLASKFDGTASITNTFKLLAYGSTPGILAYVFLIIPGLGYLLLMAGGIYSIYIIYNNLPKFVDVPEAKRAQYIGASILCTFLVNIILYSVVDAIVPVRSGVINLGEQNIDLNQLEENLKHWDKMGTKP
jgi:hypothetical protein